jgi:hypothetical protein
VTIFSVDEEKFSVSHCLGQSMWSSNEEQNKSFSQVLITEQSVLRSSDLKSSSTNQNDMLGQNDLK